MRTPGAILKKLVLVLGGLLVAVLALAGYYYMQITSDVDLSAMELASSLDLKEATRKSKLLERALKEGTQGFVRLNSTELNAFLADQYGKNSTNNAGSGPVLERCVVDFVEGDIVFYCWVSKPFLGKAWHLVWQRNARLVRNGSEWGFTVRSMHLGKVQIPEKYWPKVVEQLGAADAAFQTRFQWFSKLPAVEVHRDEASKQQEVKLYSYADTNVLAQARQ